ncbi:MAG: type II toxin-antitoxin system VapC family toxin [Acidobacteria bacterium]|nr:type II toxin-antitoxin system VapC family toxin [Acidobacteriota bacterium]
MADRLFVDANVFMYLAGRDATYRESCRHAIRGAIERGTMLTTSAEVLQEFLHYYAARGRPESARTVYQAATDICAEILPITEHQIVRALEVLVEHPGLPARDALHVATMETHGIERLLSADKEFDRIETVERVNPLAVPAGADSAS